MTALVACLLALLAYWYYSQRNSTQPQQTTATESAKQQVINNNAKDTQSSGEGLPQNSTSQTSESVTTSSTATVEITSFLQKDGYVTTTAKTSGSGTCVFLYTTDGDKPVTDEVTVSDTTCQSSLPEVKFAKLGTWNVKVTYYSNGEKVEATKDVTIQ